MNLIEKHSDRITAHVHAMNKERILWHAAMRKYLEKLV